MEKEDIQKIANETGKAYGYGIPKEVTPPKPVEKPKDLPKKVEKWLGSEQ